jgi:hypothetical protein
VLEIPERFQVSRRHVGALVGGPDWSADLQFHPEIQRATSEELGIRPVVVGVDRCAVRSGPTLLAIAIRAAAVVVL